MVSDVSVSNVIKVKDTVCKSVSNSKMAAEAQVRKKPIAEDILEATKEAVKSEAQKRIEEHCGDLHLSNHQAHILEKRMRMSIEKGLTRRGHELSSIKCFPTYVKRLPTGKEKGRFLSLDLGGTNFRVMLVDLPGSRDEKPKVGPIRKRQIPEDVMQSRGTRLLDYIAGQIAEFVRENKLVEQRGLPIGFTFSFPCEQKGLSSATLTRWTKGFNCPDLVGQDVGQLLSEAMERTEELRGGKARLVAILNDSTGCLLSCAWGEPRCRVGLIVGTGCNACYLEDGNRVEMWQQEEPGSTVVINTEWGAFGECGELDFILTKWDIAVDQESANPGMHIYEKMISGMYVGDLVRHILKDLAEQKLIFQNVDAKRLSEKGSVETRHVCEIESDPIGSFDRCREALEAILGSNEAVCESDCYAVRHVCEEVTRRACMLLAAGLAALLRRMDYKDVIIAVDGTLFRCHPLFYCIAKKKIAQLMGSDYQFDMVMSSDGSGVGAAVIAAVEAPKEE